MRHKAGSPGDFVTAGIAAVFIAGLIYVGMLLLNSPGPLQEFTEFDNAIRITNVEEEKPVEPLRRKKIKEPEPPKQLPKTFVSKARPKAQKPRLNLSVPRFDADMLPGLQGDIALPRMELGSVSFSMDEVDERPEVLRSIPPEYPYTAKRSQVTGEVVVRMLVTASGIPSNLSIYKSDPPGVFDKSALNAAKRWKFRPGRYKGESVDTWVLLPLQIRVETMKIPYIPALLLCCLLASTPCRAELSAGARQTLHTAQQLIDAKKYGQAADMLQKFVNTQGKAEAQVWLSLGGALYKSGKKGPAAQAYAKGYAQHPGNKDLCLNAGITLYETKQYAQAATFLEKAYALQKPRKAELLFQAGSAFYQGKKYADAARVLQKLLAAQRTPNKDWIRLTIHALLNAGQNTRAESLILQYLNLSPGNLPTGSCWPDCI